MSKKLPILLLVFLTHTLFGQINYNFKWEIAYGPSGGPEPAGLDTIDFPYTYQNRLACMTVGDLDGDGDIDFIAADQEGRANYYKNVGTLTAPLWAKAALPTVDTIKIGTMQNINQLRPELADVDGDGDLDLLIGSRWNYAGTHKLDDLIFFRNIGSSTNPVFDRDTIQGLQNQSVAEFANPCFVDIDGDTDLDLICLGSDSCAYFKNVGSTTNPNFVRYYKNDPENPLHGWNDPSTLVPTPDFEDLDGDGDFDLIFANDGGMVYTVENSGTATNPDFGTLTFLAAPDTVGSIDFGQFPATDVADFNNDGILDFMISPFTPIEFFWFKGVPLISNPVAATVVDSNVSCNGLSDGGATASATAGTTPYTYLWSNGATTASISGIPAGTYTVTVTDDGGLTSTSSVTVTEPAALAAAVVVDSNTTCNGYADGGLTSSASGGTMPYIYAWSNGATTASITGIIAGTYTVTITDQNGCSSTSSGTVTEPATFVAATAVDSNVSCFAYSDGGITSSASGGTIPYTYAWSNAATNASIAGIVAGTYTVTITDNNGCTSTSSATVTQPAMQVAATVVDSNVSCNGLADGGATSSASGGTAPYTYIWSNAATTASIAGIAAGTYTVTITDQNGCTSSNSATITEPAALAAMTVVDSNASCNGLADGGATAAASGGTTPYSYAWSNAATTASIAGVVAGTYTVTITDNNACTSTSSVTVTEPAALVAATVVDSNVSCNGLADGGATASATGGTMPYMYAWSNGATTASIAGVAAGTYSVTISDQNGCSSTSSTTVTEPATLVAATVVDSNVSCNAFADGGVTSSATGGTAPYTYAWSNAATTATIAGVVAGTYSVTITDQNGCTSTSSATVTEPVALVAATVVDSNVSCNGLADGGATASATGGTMPYSYEWSNSATTASIAGVVAGTYTVTVSDNNGCSSTSSVTVTEPAALVAVSVVDSNVSCNGLADGGATAAASGGTTPYTYAWSNTATTASIAGVVAGTYTVTVTDQNACTSTSSVTVTEPAALVAATVIDSNVSCNGLADGGATASATGGTMPYMYAWSNGATTASIAGVAAGTYSVTISDQNGCSSTSSATVTEPATLVASTVVDSNVSCNAFADGGITSSATGGTAPYTYAWSNAATTATIAGVVAGTYTVTITDQNGCTSTSSATVTEPVALVAATVVDSNVSCNGLADGGATATATGGTMPYSYEWSNSATTASIAGVVAGTYTVTVSDNNGCSSTSSVTITEPAALVASATLTTAPSCATTTDGAASASATGGTSPYSYLWSNGATTAAITNVAAATYTVTVTDNNGCASTSSVTLNSLDVTAPTVVTQNINIYLDASGSASITAADVDGGSTDNCTIQGMTIDKSTFSCADLGADTVILTVTDDGGNSAFDTAFVTVMDTIDPTALAQNITVYLDATGAATIAAADVDAGSSDNCGLTSTALDITNFTCSDVGNNNVTLTVMDASNNSHTAMAVVTLMDTLKPTVTTQTVTVYLDSAGSTSITAMDVDNGTTDNCSLDTLVATMTQFSCSDLGAVMGYLIATDVNGNIDSTSYTVNVMDTLMPSFTSMVDTAMCSDEIQFTMPTATDNCGAPVITQVGGPAIGSNQVPGDYYIVFEAEDAAGNLVTDSLMVTLHTLPVLDLGPDTTICVNWDIDLVAPAGYSYQWSNGVTTQTNSLAANSLALGINTFGLTITSPEGCTASDQIDIDVDPCTNIADVENGLELSLYPNPNKGEFTIEVAQAKQEVMIEIISTNGDVVYNKLHHPETGDAIQIKQTHLAKGIYIVRVSTPSYTRYEKIVVQ